MEDDDNLIHIEQKELKSYKKLYEEFIELNQSVKLYLKEDESEADQTFWFEPKVSNCQDFLRREESWVEETKLHKDLLKTSVKDITPMDSVSNVFAKQISGKSSSRSSQASSYASSVTSIHHNQ